MYEMSPIAHVHKVKAPIYLMIGTKDLRVPPSQGYEYYHNLKALGKEVEMNVYDDCHPLSKVAEV
jgi:acylaminoacyl-peptidase